MRRASPFAHQREQIIREIGWHLLIYSYTQTYAYTHMHAFRDKYMHDTLGYTRATRVRADHVMDKMAHVDIWIHALAQTHTYTHTRIDASHSIQRASRVIDLHTKAMFWKNESHKVSRMK